MTLGGWAPLNLHVVLVPVGDMWLFFQPLLVEGSFHVTMLCLGDLRNDPKQKRKK